MKRILGREKYKQLMDAARAQYRKRGRRGEHGMPTRPDLPDDEKPLPPPVP